MATENDSTPIANITQLKPLPAPFTAELLGLVQRISPDAMQRLIGYAATLAELFPRAKAPCKVISLTDRRGT